SGPDAVLLKPLAAFGIDVRMLEAPVGAASALKMCYAGMTKGVIAVGAAMLLAAQRAGVSEALAAELADSQQPLLASLGRGIPNMFPKAYRWVAEMQEIALFAHDDPAAAQMYEGASELYERLAADVVHSHRETAALSEFLAIASRG